MDREQFRDQVKIGVEGAMEVSDAEVASMVLVVCPHGDINPIPVPPHYDQHGKQIAYAWAMSVAREKGTHIAVVADVYIRQYQDELPEHIPPPSEDPHSTEAVVVLEAKDGDVWTAHRAYERLEGGGWRWRHDWQEFGEGAETDSWMVTALSLVSVSHPVSEETMSQLTQAVLTHQLEHDELSAN